MATFPSALDPRPEKSGKSRATLLRKRKDNGSYRQRQILENPEETWTLQFEFDDAELFTFKQFWNDTINEGQDFFDITLHIGGGDNTYSARIVSGSVQYGQIGANFFSVSFEVEILDIKTLTEDEYDTIVLIYTEEGLQTIQEALDAFSAALDLLNIFVEVTALADITI